MPAVMKPAKELHETGVGQPDCGMPVDGVSFRKNAGYEDGDTDDVSPRQAVESNALLSLSGPVEKAGYMVKSMRLIPTNTVCQACERVRLPRAPA